MPGTTSDWLRDYAATFGNLFADPGGAELDNPQNVQLLMPDDSLREPEPTLPTERPDQPSRRKHGGVRFGDIYPFGGPFDPLYYSPEEEYRANMPVGGWRVEEPGSWYSNLPPASRARLGYWPTEWGPPPEGLTVDEIQAAREAGEEIYGPDGWVARHSQQVEGDAAQGGGGGTSPGGESDTGGGGSGGNQQAGTNLPGSPYTENPFSPFLYDPVTGALQVTDPNRSPKPYFFGPDTRGYQQTSARRGLSARAGSQYQQPYTAPQSQQQGPYPYWTPQFRYWGGPGTGAYQGPGYAGPTRAPSYITTPNQLAWDKAVQPKAEQPTTTPTA